jgi:penicillin-binding protein 1A
MEGVPVRGTAAALAFLNRTLAGKTGTSNDAKDLWFIGYSPDVVMGAYVGFDEPRTLGRGETGSSVSVPIFKEFAQTYFKDKPNKPFRIPDGIRMVRVDLRTGQPAAANDPHAILDAFKPGTEPTGDRSVLDGSGDFSVLGASNPDGTSKPILSGTGETY